MLPPTGSGPLEVTPEWMLEQQRANAESAAPAAPAPESPVPTQQGASSGSEVAPLPAPVQEEGREIVRVREVTGYLEMPAFIEPESADPAERLEAYTQGIFAVQYAARANEERIKQQKLIGLGLRLKGIKKEELHKHAGLDTFGDLTEKRFGIKKHQANNILRVLDVAIALEDITTQELQERPLRVLVPILKNHGREAVRETWIEASRHGNVTETSLRAAANFLGYAPPKEADAQPEPRPSQSEEPEEPAPLIDSARVVEGIRVLAAKEPARARLEVQRWKKAIEKLEAELPEVRD
ncbi:hypothetical protein [Streptomyces sp. Da 82-17]|uniref:hypothetical protein n=1 Tax=Streptomyces sp. Da 82-17 TaxID=3377116 RepID=UPI0038D4DF65